MADPVQLDPSKVAGAMAATYQRIIGDLVQENAQLQQYVAELIAASNQPPPPQ